ncbi:cysteine rich repeat-containing protein [Mesorhizobium sp. BAC0120]|uniref:cysteine rich repeat-containing protein n=1 Tax=Mesorhizobium sp. BAC0120 TaxID=3090670 RepID=UPI00399AEBCC
MKSYRFLCGAFLFTLFIPIEVGHAQTISYADAITTLSQACGADIKKHCKGVNLGNNAIQSCLQENQAKVSPTCTATLAQVGASIQKRQAAQANVASICRGDAARHCKGVQPGEAHLLGCLLKAERVVTDECNQAITDAGWR